MPPAVIVATDVVLLLHVPPVLRSVNTIVEPAHTGVEPDMADGNELTVTTVVAEQPVLSAYVIIEVPADAPVTTPVPLTTVATEVVPLAHVPPVVRSVKVIVELTQTGVEPEIATGVALTVTIVVTEQPVPNE